MLAAAALLAASAPPAAAASSYCSTTGDLCYGVLADRPPVKLRITLAAKYFSRYRLCVTGPDGERDCRRFAVRRGEQGIYQSTVRWSRHFPNRGSGRYRVRYLAGGDALGPAVTFTR